MSETHGAADAAEETLMSMMDENRLARLERVISGRMVGITALLEDLHKPQNMSACMRTLEAIGIQHVHVVEGDTPFHPNSQITQGCHKWLDVHRHQTARDAVATLKADGYRVLATSPDAECTLDELDFSTPVALCFGNELNGITDTLRDAADETFRIPMFGFTRSFNISVALGMCMHTAAVSRRRILGRDSDLSDDQKAELRSRYVRLSRKNSDAILDALQKRQTP